jgi:hypothetical protein
VDERGYPVYERCEGDTWIVPYNAILLTLFECHINVEARISLSSPLLDQAQFGYNLCL